MEKQAWEERAIKMNEDGGQLKGTTTINTNSVQDVVYECCWDNCDWQFEDMTDCIDHCIAEQNGHVQSSFVNAPSGEYDPRRIAIAAIIVYGKFQLSMRILQTWSISVNGAVVAEQRNLFRRSRVYRDSPDTSKKCTSSNRTAV